MYDPDFTCPDQFDKFCGLYAPVCSEFSQNGKATTTTVDVTQWTTFIFGNILFGIIVFVASFFKPKKM